MQHLILRQVWTLVVLMAGGVAPTAAAAEDLTIENRHFQYRISAEGRNLAFVDRASGTDLLRPGPPVPCAFIRRGGTHQPVTAAGRLGDRWTFQFGAGGPVAVLRIEPRPRFVRLAVESLTGDGVESLTFVNVPLTLAGRPDEPFGACALSLNLFTRVDALPALQTELRASAQSKFGLVGAQVALVGLPMPDLLSGLKDALTEADAMPLCRVAGPWAREVPFNHGSYLFNFGTLTETNVDEWISMVRRLGFNQIDHHGGGGFFRFGDFELNRTQWPEGWGTFRRIVAQLHDAGVGSIFHTYAFFIDKQSRYVTPVPDRRLDAFRTFTLAEPLAADADAVTVQESTAGLSTITGFFEHNSVLLHLGDELVTFGGVSPAPPWRFTGLKRGALGTTPAAHPAGAIARQLKECFGLLVPDVASTLFDEIAANHAAIVNQCGFDGLYLDAIDGSSILRGPDECWYWADRFVMEIQRRLERPVGMEMSAMWHHCWQYRTRWQAWDYPQRGHRRFVDEHAAAVNGSLLLPLHLGWWNFQSWQPPQVEPTFSDVMETLGARLIGWDAGISLTGAVDRNRLEQVPLFRRAVDILRTCETLRQSGGVQEPIKARLREPGSAFRLETNAAGGVRFRPAQSLAHTASLAEPWTLAWTLTNRHPEQPMRLRLEALMSTASYDDPSAVVLGDFSKDDATAWTQAQARGVELQVTPGPEGARPPTAVWAATNGGAVPRNAAWARRQRSFSPVRNLKGHQALGVHIEGDGRGALLSFRLESPRHLAFGAVADRYVPVDFTGPRVVYLVETESARWSDFVWEDGKGLYNVYRETIDFGAVESLSVGYQNLPPGADVRCRLGAIKALPMVPCTLTNPTFTVNDRTFTLAGELTSGEWIELEPGGSAVRYGPQGERRGTVECRGELPPLRAGENRVRVACDDGSGPAPRLKITWFSLGDAL